MMSKLDQRIEKVERTYPIQCIETGIAALEQENALLKNKCDILIDCIERKQKHINRLQEQLQMQRSDHALDSKRYCGE